MPDISQHLSPTRQRRSHYIVLLCGLLTLTAQLALWHLYIQDTYFPAGDDFSLIAHSTRVFHASPVEWITHGFSGYFKPYPDLSLDYSNFLRPVDNAVYYLNSLLFGSNWSYYLLVNYAIVAAVVTLVCWIALVALELPLVIGLLITVATMTSSAFTAQIVYRPSFAFDYLAALWVLLTLTFLISKKFGWAWLTIWLAVFTKEQGFFTAVAAAIAMFCLLSQRRLIYRTLMAVVFLIPLATMLVLRRMDFRDLGGVYVASGLSPLQVIKHIVLGVTNWPFILPGEQHIFARTWHNIGSLALSAILWGLLGVAVYRYLWPALRLLLSEQKLPRLDDFSSRSMLIVLFLLGSLTLPIVFDLTPRFGATCLPLFFLTLGCIGKIENITPIALWIARSSTIVLIVIIGFDLLALQTIADAKTVAFEQQQWNLSRSFISTLAALPRPVAFLVDNASSGFSSPDSIRIFSGYEGEIIPISDLGMQACSAQPHLSLQETGTSRYSFSSDILPACGSNRLQGAYRLDRISGTDFERDLPAALVRYHATDRPDRKEEFETHHLKLDLQIRSTHFAIVLPNAQTTAYSVIVSDN